LLTKLAPEITEQTWCSGSLMAVSKGLYVLIPLSFALAIVKYRLMDIDLLLRKTVVYAAMSAFVVLAFLLLVGGLGVALVAWTGVQNQVVTVLATLLLVAVFVPVRNRVQSLVDRRYGGAPSRDEALAGLRRAVLAASDLETLLPRLAETTQQALGSRAVVVFVRPVHGGALEARAKVGVPDEVLSHLRLDAAPLAAAGRVVECGETALDDDDRQALRRLRLAWLAPARRGGEVVAALATGRHLDGSDPEPDELEFLAAVADQLTLAVGTLGPRREAVELDQARELQRSLLPGELPRLAGADLAALWQPAREVAGDYYDALDFGADGAALCIGDVAGKGMPAALLMASLQAAVRAVARPDADPAHVCEQVRRVVCQSLAGGRFVTFFYAFLRPADGGLRLTYTNAGHVPPLLHRAGGGGDGGRVERLEAGGGAFVRLLAGTPLTSATVELAPGDRLLLLTDGVTEAQSADGEIFGEERLEELLLTTADPTAAGLAHRVAAEVGRHAAGDPTDDITLLALRTT
jgi:sigma-B regulation protein RsbU (phosphoserine phosphatase)